MYKKHRAFVLSVYKSNLMFYKLKPCMTNCYGNFNLIIIIIIILFQYYFYKNAKLGSINSYNHKKII
jgi:hypothetical protein